MKVEYLCLVFGKLQLPQENRQQFNQPSKYLVFSIQYAVQSITQFCLVNIAPHELANLI